MNCEKDFGNNSCHPVDGVVSGIIDHQGIAVNFIGKENL